MQHIDMPAGRYFSLSGMIRAGTGGQTRALLMRNRLLATRAGITPSLLTFDAAPLYHQVRADLCEQGQLVDPMRLLNMFEWLREKNIDHLSPAPDPLLEVEGFDTLDELHPDGTVYITRYVHRRSREDAIHDYRRADGSVYLRMPAGPSAVKNPASPVVLVNSKGEPVGRWPKKGGLYRRWLKELAASDERIFIISDSRYALAHVVPLKDERFHIVHLMHNTHTVGERNWNSPLSADYGPLLNSIAHLDGLVTLTHRQREEVSIRYGRTNNLFVVPNPVESPPRPDPLPKREARRFAIVSRLEPQKRLDHAIAAWSLVVGQEPDALLDIYGDGSLRVPLQEQINRLGLQDSVRLCGHDPRARDALWTATGFLMTSGFEGYPLATLESMSHGCPVISYDIKYGPREQITDGVDGFLVPAGDTQAVADRAVKLIRNPELVLNMSKAAFKKAHAHDHSAFLDDWREVLESVVANKATRTELRSVTLDVHELGYVDERPLPGRYGRARSSSGAFRSSRKVTFKGALHVAGRSKEPSLADAQVTLEAVCDETGEVVSIPLTSDREKRVFGLTASFDIAELFSSFDEQAHDVRLRLRLVWRNSSWETDLTRPPTMEPNYEVAFNDRGKLHLLRGPGARDDA